MDLHQLGYWLIVTALFVVAPFLLRRSAESGGAAKWLSKWGSWAIDRMRPAPEVDHMANELYQVLRREKICADIQRLRRIVATDASMSATRQIANRLAYDWLLREFEEIRTLVPTPPSGPLNAWEFAAPTPARTDTWSSSGTQHSPQVEILDIGWRR